VKELQKVFNYSDIEVRTVIKDGEPWFVAKDVCNVLELDNVTRAIERLDEDEKGLTSIQTLGGQQEVNMVTESGLYNLIFTSRKEEAKQFRRWVTNEVLPSIRKTGRYELPASTKQLQIKLDYITGDSINKTPEQRKNAIHRIASEFIDNECAKIDYKTLEHTEHFNRFMESRCIFVYRSEIDVDIFYRSYLDYCKTVTDYPYFKSDIIEKVSSLDRKISYHKESNSFSGIKFIFDPEGF